MTWPIRILLGALALLPGSANAVELYNAAAGTAPGQQSWTTIFFPTAGGVTAAADGGALVLDTLADQSVSYGYFSRSPIVTTLPAFVPEITPHPGVPVLDRGIGFRLSFDLRIARESHGVRDDNGDDIDDRAGFSIIVVCNDMAAIEIAFWEDEIWAYADDSANPEDLFTHAEGAAFDTVTSMRRYTVTVQSDSYAVSVANTGGTESLLTGPLRDYSAWPGVDIGELPGVPPLPGLPDEIVAQPYAVANLLFFGDNTSSAASRSELGKVELELLQAGSVLFEDSFEGD